MRSVAAYPPSVDGRVPPRPRWSPVAQPDVPRRPPARATDSSRATVPKGGLVHMDKLRFFDLRVSRPRLTLRATTALYYLTQTSMSAP